MSRSERRAMIVRDHPALSLSRQCRLLSLGRSSLYYDAEGGERGDAGADAADRRALPEVSVLRRPSDGTPPAPRGRADRATPGQAADAPDGASGNLSGAAHQRAPARAPGLALSAAGVLAIERPNHVWCADITYIPVQRGFLYLVAIMDWASRYVLAWRLSNTLDASFCTDALDEALARHGKPEIFNTDQGSQFTSFAFTGRSASTRASGSRWMAGAGAWTISSSSVCGARSNTRRSTCTKSPTVYAARCLIREWVRFYNVERPHLALDGRTPAEAYRADPPVDMMDKPLRALPTSPQAQQQQQEDRFKGSWRPEK